MNQLKLYALRNSFVVLLSLVLISLAGQASAQNTAPPAAQPPPAQQQQQTTQRSTTTTTQTERAVEGVNPLWFILGGIGLLAIILIAILASRGRSADSHTHVSERTTVIKKE